MAAKSKPTKNLDHVRHFVAKKFVEWKELYGDNDFFGVHVGEKTKGGKKTSKLSIVFHVKAKNQNPKNKIPDFFPIKGPSGRTQKIHTDVIETGEFKFHRNIEIGDLAKHTQSVNQGTLGLFLKRNGHVYGCSNMHVLGEPLLQQGMNVYYKDISQQTIIDSNFRSINTSLDGFLEQAVFGGLDAAISRVADESLIDNNIKGIGAPNGIYILTDSNYKGLQVNVSTSRGVLPSVVQSNGAVLATQLFQVKATMTELICLSKVTEGGDSGAVVVVGNTRKVLGIVMGADLRFTYVIPVWKILNHFTAIMYQV